MVKRDAKKHIFTLIISVFLIFLIVFILIPTTMSVELNSGSQSPSSLTVGNTVIFNNVRLTIRNTERIDINYLKFSIYNSNNQEVAYVSFNIYGTEIAESPAGSFTVTNLTDITGFYSTGGSSYGYDERTGKYIPNYNSGYSCDIGDLDILYTITFIPQIPGTFYSKLLVNSSLYNYLSSTTFTVNPTGGVSNGSTSNNTPVADAGRYYFGLVNTVIIFNGSASTDSDGTITSYFWSFGDGETGTGLTAKHTYSTAGTYIITLTVTDNDGRNDTDSTTITIFEEGVAQLPIADPGGPYNGLTYQLIALDGSNSFDLDGTISTYIWDFGDGVLGLGEKPTHIYSTAGEFTITLTVTDSDGLSYTKTTNATIALDSDADGWSDELEDSYKTNVDDSNDIPSDTDADGIPDNSSPDGKYKGDIDDDNDGINDITEEAIHSNPKNSDDVDNITINGKKSYMVDIDGDSNFDKYYNPTTDIITDVQYIDRKYFINIDVDPEWEIVYDPSLGTITQYEKKEEEKPDEESSFIIPIITVIAVIALIIIIIAVLFKTGYLYIEEVPIEENIKKPEEKLDDNKKDFEKKKKITE